MQIHMTWRKSVIGIASLILVAIGSLVFLSNGEQDVMPLVTSDPSLPSRTILGRKLHMEIADGPEGADTIIVLHGGPGGDFRALQGLKELSDQYRIVFYDQRGAGLSERVPSTSLGLGDYVAELSAVIDAVSPNQSVILIGHSWGGILATAYLGQHADKISRAVLIEPGFLESKGRVQWQLESKRFLSGLSYWSAALLAGIKAQQVEKVDAAAQDDFLYGEMAAYFANHPDNPYHCGEGYHSPSWRFGAVASRMMDEFPNDEFDNVAKHAGKFQGPVMLMAGDCDHWIGEAKQHAHTRYFAKANVRVIENAGHNPIWDNPRGSIAAIRDFLN